MKAQAWTRNPTRAFRHFQYSITKMLMSNWTNSAITKMRTGHVRYVVAYMTMQQMSIGAEK